MTEARHRQRVNRLLWDAFFIAISGALAFAFASSGALDVLIAKTVGHPALSSFLTGIFFTSAFTTAPAMVVLGKLGATFDIATVALAGGLGALIGDLVIFSFVKGRLSDDLMYLFSRMKASKLQSLMRFRGFRLILAICGAAIIASPLPDELGLALMGMSRISLPKFMAVSFAFNTIGIAVIAYVARSI